MDIQTKLVYLLKQIELNKLLNDTSLGRYAKIHIKHLYLNYYDYYCEFVKEKRLMKYLSFIENDSNEMYKNILEEYGNLGPCSWKNADDWVVNKLTCKLNKKTSSPYPFL